MSVTFDDARRAKQELSRLLGASPMVVSIGVVRFGDGFAVRLSLREKPAVDSEPLRSILGVPVLTEIVAVPVMEGDAPETPAEARPHTSSAPPGAASAPSR